MCEYRGAEENFLNLCLAPSCPPTGGATTAIILNRDALPVIRAQDFKKCLGLGPFIPYAMFLLPYFLNCSSRLSGTTVLSARPSG